MEDLFDYSNVSRKLKSGTLLRQKIVMEYRKPLPTREVKRVDQVITDVVVDDKSGTCEVYYYMARDKERREQPPYRVPQAQFPFIADLIEAGLMHKPLWIDIEISKANANLWIRVEEK